MLIKCPNCGERPSEEYTYLGDASVKRPASNDASTMDEWFDYVFIRRNIKGRTLEHWQHSAGCRSWLVIDRDTVTHEIFSVALANGETAKVRA